MGGWRRAMGTDDGAIDPLIGACVEKIRGAWFIRGHSESGFLPLRSSVKRKIHFGERRNPDLDHVQGLVEIRLLKVMGELQECIHAGNWMPTELPNQATVNVPLRNLLEACLRHTSRTEGVTTRRAVSDSAGRRNGCRHGILCLNL